MSGNFGTPQWEAWFRTLAIDMYPEGSRQQFFGYGWRGLNFWEKLVKILPRNSLVNYYIFNYIYNYITIIMWTILKISWSKLQCSRNNTRDEKRAKPQLNESLRFFSITSLRLGLKFNTQIEWNENNYWEERRGKGFESYDWVWWKNPKIFIVWRGRKKTDEIRNDRFLPGSSEILLARHWNHWIRGRISGAGFRYGCSRSFLSVPHRRNRPRFQGLAQRTHSNLNYYRKAYDRA